MTSRSEVLQLFIDAALAAFEQFAQASESRRSIRQISSALEVPATERPGSGSRLPVCFHLEAALAIETEHESLRRLVDRFKAIEPLLEWRRRSNYDGSESENFFEGHANAMIIGPGGLEERRDVWLGVTLMAPNVRYPNHDHAPEEVYLVLSDGEFRQGEAAWFSPGIGGSFYNPPGVKHAMRSLERPLLAFWALLSAKPA
ncbi:dimethylsulfoniopropionate lyase [Sinorhizobium numidicum]|uniref:Dimethylsulfoniopropionate lyase n=1 Tax=Sinorhizobium numidicum TaxID=680248 RepID=A0ABY8CWG9_9HYPH|nr:dimethylsulfoniopropionate lyase [Sinorhizobium numidicum]WEX78416.1 dimethylsulfoniopropionate lyase [Sinorhizobium numidicum]WEX81812.1 dimethylsulfoniopropionate lyase [Sinorhizobium numidicum]